MRYYYENSKLTVRDTRTGLSWLLLQEAMTHSQALVHAQQWAEETGLAWRLPSLTEVLTLIDRSRQGPASAFPGLEVCRLWTACEFACEFAGSNDVWTNDVWTVDTAVGEVGYTYPDSPNNLILVRGKKNEI
jgi:hypothetical protein